MDIQVPLFTENPGSFDAYFSGMSALDRFRTYVPSLMYVSPQVAEAIRQERPEYMESPLSGIRVSDDLPYKDSKGEMVHAIEVPRNF